MSDKDFDLPMMQEDPGDFKRWKIGVLISLAMSIVLVVIVIIYG